MSDNVIIPRVNVNGTGIDQLLQQHVEAIGALRSAIVAVQDACPHGRDYQTHHLNYAHRQAMFQHLERMMRLNQILKEVTSIAEGISEQHRG